MSKDMRKRALSILLAASMVMGMMPSWILADEIVLDEMTAEDSTVEAAGSFDEEDLESVQAELEAGVIGRVSINGKKTDYTSLSKLADAVYDAEGKTIIIDMYADWGNERLRIPEESNTTFNMHGHVFDRGLTSGKTDGEVIYVDDDAKLTINGASNYDEQNAEHTVKVYNDWRYSAKADAEHWTSGGVITGGYSTNGSGGIDVKSNATLTLNGVTIAGCRAEQSWGTDGYGGGIWVHGGTNKAGTVSMNNSSIIGCYAYNDGGGLYMSNHDNFLLEMKNSHIDNNYCYDEGAGICIDGESVVIRGSGNSSVSYNISGSGNSDNGGGIYLWNDDVSVSGLSICYNRGGNGGGIYCLEEGVSITDCVIEHNRATNRGGGIYVNNDNTTISNCTIRYNTAANQGNGVYINTDVDEGFGIKGKTVISDNDSSNLYVEDSSRVNFELTKDSKVYMKFRTSPSEYKMVTQGKVGDTFKSPNCIRYLYSDVEGYHFSFNSAPNQRKIYLVKDGYTGSEAGDAYVPGKPEKITSAEADAAAKTAVGGASVTGSHDLNRPVEYSLYRGFFRYPSAEDSTKDSYSVYYYSDGFFDTDPVKYSEHLASLSIAMAMAGMYLPTEQYSYRHAAIRQLMADIGVDDQNIYVNDYNVTKPGTDTIGVTIGSKELKSKDGTGTGKTLIPIVVRGGNYEAEWASNMKLGIGADRNGEAEGFAEAAEHVLGEIEFYLDKYGLRDELAAGDVKFWVMGFSRAGATSNLLSRRLVEKYACSDAAEKNNEVFGYCLEAPQGGTDEAEQLTDKSKYYCIHNVINYSDVVPLVGPSRMGFKRYGVDHYMPGTEAGSVSSRRYTVNGAGSYSGATKLTTYADNKPVYTKENGSDNKEYVTLKNEMLEQLYAVDSTIVYDDYFHLMELNFVPGISIEEAGSYSVRVEDFIRDFFYLFQIWSIESRDTWAADKVVLDGKEYETMQQAMRETCALIFGMSDEALEGFVNKASGLAGSISTVTPFSSEYSLLDVYMDVIMDWSGLSDSKKNSYITFLWNKLKATGALQYLSDDEVTKLEKNFPTIANRLLDFVCEDYKHTYQTCSVYSSVIQLGTFAGNSSRILMNHYPEVDFAWLRADDSYFNGEIYDEGNKEYAVTASMKVNEPKAYVIAGDETEESEGELRALETAPAMNVFSGNRRVLLDVDDISGETIYYTLMNSSGEILAKNQIYRGGIDLTTGVNDTAETYTITAWARSHKKDSYSISYRIELVGKKRELVLNIKEESDAGTIDVQNTFSYPVGEVVYAVASVPSNKFFMRWIAKDETGRDVTDLLIPEAAKQRETAVEFKMPDTKTDGFAEDYRLIFTAVYGDKIDEMTLTPYGATNDESGVPKAGEWLASRVKAEWNGEKPVVFNSIVWTVSYEGRSVLALGGDAAYNNTSYTMSVRMPQGSNMQFMPGIRVHFKGVPDDKVTVSRNPADGSLTAIVQFDATQYAGEEYDLQPESMCKITVVPWDVNTDRQAAPSQDYWLFRNRWLLINPPAVADEVFWNWDIEEYADAQWDILDGDGAVRLYAGSNSPSEITVRANYRPVVKRIEIEVGESGWVPEAGMPSSEIQLEHVYITVTDRYEVAKTAGGRNLFEIKWTPNVVWNKTQRPYYQMFNYDTAYTLAVSYMPDTRYKAHVINTVNGEEYDIESKFIYAEDLEVLINGRTAAYNKSQEKAYVTFPKTASGKTPLLSFKLPEDITGLPFGTTEEEIRSMLPETVSIVVEDASVSEAAIVWSSLKPDIEDNDYMGELVWTAMGTLELPKGVSNENDIGLETVLRIKVDGAGTASAPDASRQSGAYESDIIVMLSTATEGGEIHYTVDGSTPTSSSPVYSEGIPVTRELAGEREDGEFIIRAITVKDGMKNSSETLYLYSFTDEFAVPKGNMLSYNTRSQIGLKAGEYYTLEAVPGSGVSIDEDGNAIASAEGTYQVIAKIKDGYMWKVKKEVEETVSESEWVEVNGEYTERITEKTVARMAVETTDEDQVITFNIGKASLQNAEVIVDDAYFAGVPVEPEVKVVIDGTEVDASEYDVSYSDNTAVGTGTVTVTGKEINYTGTAEGTFEVAEWTGPEFRSKAMLLSGQVGMNFFMKLPEADGVDYASSYMTFDVTGPGKITARTDYDPANMNQTGEYYGFICYLTSIQMAETITATYHYQVDGDEKTVKTDYSIKQYLDYFKENPEYFDDATKALVEAVGNYGYYVQQFLSKANGFVVGAGGYAAMPAPDTADYDVPGIANRLRNLRFVRSGEAVDQGDLAAVTYRLNLDTDTSIDLFLTPEKGEKITASVTLANGKTYAAKRAGSRYILHVPGIVAYDWGNYITVVGEAGGKAFEIKVCPLSYAYSVLSGSNDDIFGDYAEDARKAMAAYVAYHDAAIAYAGKID